MKKHSKNREFHWLYSEGDLYLQMRSLKNEYAAARFYYNI